MGFGIDLGVEKRRFVGFLLSLSCGVDAPFRWHNCQLHHSPVDSWHGACSRIASRVSGAYRTDVSACIKSRDLARGSSTEEVSIESPPEGSPLCTVRGSPLQRPMGWGPSSYNDCMIRAFLSFSRCCCFSVRMEKIETLGWNSWVPLRGFHWSIFLEF
jgi:hypothetical protein